MTRNRFKRAKPKTRGAQVIFMCHSATQVRQLSRTTLSGDGVRRLQNCWQLVSGLLGQTHDRSATGSRASTNTISKHSSSTAKKATNLVTLQKHVGRMRNLTAATQTHKLQTFVGDISDADLVAGTSASEIACGNIDVRICLSDWLSQISESKKCESIPPDIDNRRVNWWLATI